MNLVNQLESLAERKLRRRVARYEEQELMKEKRSEQMDSLEEVFDRSTLMTVYHMLNSGLIKKINGVARSGKEARLYWGIGPRHKTIAIKIYLTSSAEFKRGRMMYIEGDERFKAARKDTRSLVNLWALKEFKNLKQARIARVRVPNPIKVQRNVLVMEFIGQDGTPAPLLRETPLNHPGRVYDKIAEALKRLFQKAELIHGDLSEYNIMMVGTEPVIFDMAQAVPPSHPMARAFLERDLNRLNTYFSRIGVTVAPIERLLPWVMGENGD
jgi:RIO kinase 1